MAQSGEELKELTKYLQNIKSYELQYLKSERATIGIVWGILIFVAGLIDGYIASFSSINYSPHGPVWFLTIAAAMIIQQVISSQPLLYNKEFTDEVQRDQIPKWEVVLIIFIMGVTIFIAEINIAFIMPYIGFTTGLINLVLHVRNNKGIDWKKSSQFLPFFVAALLLVTLYLIDVNTAKFFGLIFGLIIGGTVFLSAYRNRNQVEVE